MKLRLDRGVPLVSVTIVHQGKQVTFDKVVLDTGSASSIFWKDELDKHGISQESGDANATVTGIGGKESVVVKRIDEIRVGDLRLADYEIDIGNVKYIDDIDGLLGFDFLYKAYGIVDCDKMELSKGR